MQDDTNTTIKTHVPDKELSELTRRNIEMYENAVKLALSGVPKEGNYPRTYNEEVENRFEGLKLMIRVQQQILNTKDFATIKKNCENNWKRKYKTESGREENPFEDEDNDANELEAISYFLDECEEKIENSILTESLEDDFIKETDMWDGTKRKQLTSNFKNMFKELKNSFEIIYQALIDHKIVTLGATEDADKSEKEKEEEFVRRVLNA